LRFDIDDEKNGYHMPQERATADDENYKERAFRVNVDDDVLPACSVRDSLT
jgi:hypothetical protein